MPIGFDLAALKASSRQSLHTALAVAAVYEDSETSPTPITVRSHNKMVRAGALDGGFGVEVFEGLDRLIFNDPELTSKGIILYHGGYVTIPQYGLRYSLEAQEQSDGPLNIYWTVAAITPDKLVTGPDNNIYIGTEDGAIISDDEGEPFVEESES